MSIQTIHLSLLFFIIILISSCKNKDKIGAQNNTEKESIGQDRYFGVVNIDTIEFYSKLAFADVTIKNNGNKLLIYTTIDKKKEFISNILGQELDMIVQLYENDKINYKDKWNPINNNSIYGFECKLYEQDNKYVYMPYEILIQLNNKRKI